MASGQPSSLPPPYDMALSPPSYGQPLPAPPPYSESPQELSPYGQNHPALSSSSHLPYAPPSQGYSVHAESNFESYTSRTSSYPSANGGQNVPANHQICECQNSCRHCGIVGHPQHGHPEPVEQRRHRRRRHRHHRRRRGLIGLIRDLVDPEPHNH
ncbi:hypothetical protein GDO78_002695 [Eleutherodactylus coqui]|uniref:Uncharacterized protein n=1 Tax=Eleutherodactylus coqui TaxID=57060 RepID=A0A8J6EZG2_ELECQ|nr:hypothetical protein GDO78_002695 [Eleutherodactylus coqui]